MRHIYYGIKLVVRIIIIHNDLIFITLDLFETIKIHLKMIEISDLQKLSLHISATPPELYFILAWFHNTLVIF